MKKSNDNKNTALYGVVDERVKAVVYQGDAYTGRFMLFAVLLDVFVRGLNLNLAFIQSNWDLIAIVMVGSLISTIHQMRNKVIFQAPSSRSILFLIAVIGISAILGFVFAVVLPK